MIKLIVAIVNKDDSSPLVNALVKGGFMSTRLSTTGGFLRSGNITLLIGTEDEKVDKCIDIISQSCSRRTQVISTMTGNYSDQFLTSLPVEVSVGGATVFVVDVEKFIKL